MSCESQNIIFLLLKINIVITRVIWTLGFNTTINELFIGSYMVTQATFMCEPIIIFPVLVDGSKL